MEKYLKFFSLAILFVFSGYTAYNSILYQDGELSQVCLANLEALSTEFDWGDGNGENDGSKHFCYDRYSSADWFHKDDTFILCYDCAPRKGQDLQDRNTCINKY